MHGALTHKQREIEVTTQALNSVFRSCPASLSLSRAIRLVRNTVTVVSRSCYSTALVALKL